MTTEPVPIAQRLLRSVLGGGFVYLGLWIVVHGTLALTSRGANGWDLLSLALVVAPQYVLVRQSRLDVPLRTAVALAVLTVAGGLAGLMSIAGIAQPDGYDAWFLGAVAFDLLALTVVGRFGTAWITMVLVVAACLGWAALGDRPIGIGAGIIVRHVATLAVGTALAASLRRSNAASAAFREVQRRRRTEEDVARARASARRSAVEQVLEQAGPMLRAIAEGRRMTAEDRRQMIVIEGALRDQIRTPRLNESDLRGVIDAARRRGVNVLLLDEAEEAGTDARRKAARWLAERLEQTAEGGFIGRLRDLEGGGVRASAVRGDQSEAEVFQ
ncbi:hypothetical protein [Amnibacterium kyonggiense]|uniref:Signal transduction histidine kinase n=1 Tax=Amnibacterium kyonggiense TaxID=595671 RepID=A0A4R7FIW0_9MICO|nr:hypothetical protein [Amnibacterium kyonggiense]TDS74862.1 hypothetical protein CLV52_3384 [Amnibacterium kyonggiense]